MHCGRAQLWGVGTIGADCNALFTGSFCETSQFAPSCTPPKIHTQPSNGGGPMVGQTWPAFSVVLLGGMRLATEVLFCAKSETVFLDFSAGKVF